LTSLLVAAPLVRAAEEVVELDDFVVTAQKREQSIDEVSIPITAHSGLLLERAGATDLTTLAPFVPGFFVHEPTVNTPNINIRGITTDTGDPRREARISIFQDGVSISRLRGAATEFFDLERVEVLKGPQGTLFGRGAETGAISIVQNKPRDETTAALSLGVGNFGERRASGHFNTPLVAGRLFGRVAFTHRSFDGTVDNLADGSALNGKDTFAARGALRWTPDKRTTVDAIFNWQRDRPPGTDYKSGVIPTSRGDTDPFAPAELNRGGALALERTVWGGTLIATHDLSAPGWSITSITGWREFDSYEDFDADGSRLALLEMAVDTRGRQFSQEVRATFERGRFAGFAGASWFREDNSSRVPFVTDERQLWPFLSGQFRDGLLAGGVPATLVNFAVPTLNPFAPQPALPATFAAFANPGLPASLQALAGLAGAPLKPVHHDEYMQTARTRALDVFLDGTWRATDRLSLTGGVRLSREEQRSTYEVINGTPPTTLGFIVNQIPGYPYLPMSGRRALDDTATGWVGRSIATWKFSDTFNAYASVARGRRPPSVLVDSATSTVAREEVVWNHELGLKGALADGRLHFSASAFLYRYQHFHTAVISFGRITIADAGNATGRGVEFSLQGTVSPQVMLFSTFAATRATFDDTGDDGRPQGYAGFTFARTPRTSFSLGGTFTLPAGRSGSFFATPVWHYRSGHFFSDNNASFAGSLHQGAFGMVNLRAGWRSADTRWEITAWADNLLDRRHLVDAGNLGGSFGIPTFTPGQPRHFGLTVAMRW
jgi:iron complex outermembrane recepter protein